MEVPAEIRRAIDGYLGAVDRALPGFVTGLYLTGSIPLGDYQPGMSDVDLVAVCADRPTERHIEALSELHRPSQPSVDVLYVTADDLLTDPREVSPPHSLEGVFKPLGAFSASPVTWRQLTTAAVAIRGPVLTADDVWFEADALRRWNVGNLDDYWVPWLQGWRGAEPTELGVRHKSGLQWLVLGVPRLHYTITTLAVTSKTGAGRYALGVVDNRWHAVIEVAMALRADQRALLPRPVEALHQDAADVSAWLIEDAHRRLPA